MTSQSDVEPNYYNYRMLALYAVVQLLLARYTALDPSIASYLRTNFDMALGLAATQGTIPDTYSGAISDIRRHFLEIVGTSDNIAAAYRTQLFGQPASLKHRFLFWLLRG
jgi:hypothetical protein